MASRQTAHASGVCSPRKAPFMAALNISSREIRQSFLDFFKSKGHTIVRSSSLLPSSPNLLFTNAGMNQFVPIFLGQQPCPYSPPRAVDTQKCIRAGGKHNDLEDVGYDTYHHTFFEMLGNWSFGDYFKKEAITWGWELMTKILKFPKERIYATVYQPGHDEPASFDQEAFDCWKQIFDQAGLDPHVHIVFGGKKDNFWMMGDTGPCGPCSEIHVDLTPEGNTQGKWVNTGSPHCIEIWNLVFIQLNAESNGKFSDLPSRHVDTGAGLERICSVLQCTHQLTDFKSLISNYETDLFRPIFSKIEELSRQKYTSSLPSTHTTEQEQKDVAFRAIADHIRTLSFAIADGILPSNEGRGYVLRRILRRAVRFGRRLGFQEPFFFKLVDVIAENYGDIFSEINQRKEKIVNVIQNEEKSFNETLDRGIEIFQAEVEKLKGIKIFSGETAFKLYDTYGFPLDLTELMARELGLTVDTMVFEKFMEEQRDRARASQKKEAIEVSGVVPQITPTLFVGYDTLNTPSRILDVVEIKGKQAVILEKSPFYAEMGGQVGDRGQLILSNQSWKVVDTQKKDDVFFHILKETDSIPPTSSLVQAEVNSHRRAAIERHHTVTHLFHWALHQLVDQDSRQRGSYVSEDYLRFDFNLSHALTSQQIIDIEKLVNERIQENSSVIWYEQPYLEAQKDPSIQQFFGDQYGEIVRIVEIGDYSKELCGGTHVRKTGDIGLFKIKKESAIAAGIRRIEAVAGTAAEAWVIAHAAQLQVDAEKARLKAQAVELDKQRKIQQQEQARLLAKNLFITEVRKKGDLSIIIKDLGMVDGDFLRMVIEFLRQEKFPGVTVLAGRQEDRCYFACSVAPHLTQQIHAGEIIKQIASVTGGSGGGKSDFAQAGGKNPSRIPEALALAETLLALP